MTDNKSKTEFLSGISLEEYQAQANEVFEKKVKPMLSQKTISSKTVQLVDKEALVNAQKNVKEAV